MPIGLDLNPYSLRITNSNSEDRSSTTYYGIQGIAPRWNEPIVWTDPLTVRHSFREEPISLMKAWWQFSQNHQATMQFRKTSEAEPITTSAVHLICEALKEHLSKYSEEFAVLAVDNLLPEFQQTALLGSMGQLGFGRRELLWRPIALALAHLSGLESVPYDEGDRLIFVDTDTYVPEITVLTMREHREHLVPLREYPTEKRIPENQPHTGYNSHNLICEFMEQLGAEDPDIAAQLKSGPFTHALLRFLDSGDPEDIWVRHGLNHKKLVPQSSWLDQLRSIQIEGQGWHEILGKVEAIETDTSARAIIWNGVIARLFENDTDGQILLNPDSVSEGAAEYGRRHLAGIPAYLDTLPGLEILSRDEAARKHNYYDVIPGGEVEGGRTIRIPEPLKQFSLEKDTKTFTAILHNVAEDSYRRYDTLLPEIDYENHIPLILRAEAQPGQGHALVTIEGSEGHEDVFGELSHIELDWESGIDWEPPPPACPEVYPIRGRIADDEDCRSAAEQMAREQQDLEARVRFRHEQVAYTRVHEPWGYNDPFGQRLGEPTRALFGAMDENDPEITELAEDIGRIISDTSGSEGERQKYLNYMFRYAPESFRDELRNLFSMPNPPLNWNTVFAVGRSFYRRSDFELFLDFFLRKSENSGFPDYPDDSYTSPYFWSFFRGLCYYEETATADRQKVEGVLECIFNYSNYCSNAGWPRGRRANVIKYLLCGILFSLRLRAHHRDFLEPNQLLYDKMLEAITNLMPRINYPVAMFANVQPDMLNDYVLRFLNEEQTAEDMNALQGLVIAV